MIFGKSRSIRQPHKQAVRDYHAGVAAPLDRGGQFARKAATQDRCVVDRSRAFARLIDDIQNANR